MTPDIWFMEINAHEKSGFYPNLKFPVSFADHQPVEMAEKVSRGAICDIGQTDGWTANAMFAILFLLFNPEVNTQRGFRGWDVEVRHRCPT